VTSPEAPDLEPADVRHRALAGVALVGLRGVGVRVLALAGNVLLARLLLPREFGTAAVGLTLLLLTSFLSDAGIAAALVRRAEPPTRDELRVVLGLQLVLAVVLAAAISAAAWPFGRTGHVAAVMAWSLPLGAARTPAAVALERRLEYRVIVLVELVDTLVYYGWAVAGALLGHGVWALATAALARAVAGTVVILARCPEGRVGPRVDFRRVRELLGFGATIQAIGLANIARDQGLNLGLAAVGGVTVLGLWTLAYRVLQLPFLVFESLWRVSFPAMSRLLAAGEDVVGALDRGVRRSAVATALVLAPLAATAVALVPVAFGHEWDAASSVVPTAALGLMLSGPLSAMAGGYLYAVGDARAVLRGVVLHTIAWAVVALPLVDRLGVAAMGWGWLAACVVETAVLSAALRRHAGTPLLAGLVVPTLAATAGAVVGRVATDAIGDVGGVLVGGVVAVVATAAVLAVADRGSLRDTGVLVATAARAARGHA
jgi:O-antigen/teichoic acid export membrane protein